MRRKCCSNGSCALIPASFLEIEEPHESTIGWMIVITGEPGFSVILDKLAFAAVLDMYIILVEEEDLDVLEHLMEGEVRVHDNGGALLFSNWKQIVFKIKILSDAA